MIKALSKVDQRRALREAKHDRSSYVEVQGGPNPAIPDPVFEEAPPGKHRVREAKKPLQLWLDPELVKEIRIAAAEQEVTPAEFMQRAIRSALGSRR